jgi:hypothetical protein
MVAEGNKEFTLFVTINLQSFERANIQRNICPEPLFGFLFDL